MTRRFQVAPSIGYENIDFPWINVLHQQSRNPAVGVGCTEDECLLIKANGLPSRMANGSTTWTISLTAYIADPADGFNGRWVLDWIGTGVTLSLGAPGQAGVTKTDFLAVATNRNEYEFSGSAVPTGTPLDMNITITAIGATDFDRLRFYRKSEEASQTAGNVVSQKFCDVFGEFEYIRPMDYLQINFNGFTDFSDYPTVGNLSWTGNNINPGKYAGYAKTASGGSNDFITTTGIAGNPTSWVDGMSVQFRFPTYTIAGITAGATTSFNVVGHGMQAGDAFCALNLPATWNALGAFGSGSQNGTGNAVVCKVLARIDADNFTCAINSTGFPALTFPNTGYRICVIPTSKGVTGWNNAPDVTLTIPAHGFPDGCKVFSFLQSSPSGVANTVLASAFPTIHVVDSDHIQLLGIDSTTWGAYGSPTTLMQIGRAITLQCGSLPPKICTATLTYLWFGSSFNAQVSRGYCQQVIYRADIDKLTMGTSYHNQVRNGCPIEPWIEFANRTGCKIWMNYPLLANDAWFTTVGTKLKNGLTDITLKSMHGLSNEVWNTNFSQTTDAAFLGTARFGVVGTYCGFEFFGARCYQMFAVLDTVFAGQLNRIEKVIETHLFHQAGLPLTTRFEAPTVVANGYIPEAPYRKATALAPATYINPVPATTMIAEKVWKFKQGGALRQEAIDWLVDKIRNVDITGQHSFTEIVATFAGWGAACQAYGLRGHMYEGGANFAQYTNASFPLSASSYDPGTGAEALLQNGIIILGMANNGSGAIRCTVPLNATAALVSGQKYWIVRTLGTVEANGFWQITVIDSTHFDLVGSTFTNTFVLADRTACRVISDVDNFAIGVLASQQWAYMMQDLNRAWVAACGSNAGAALYSLTGGQWASGFPTFGAQEIIFGNAPPATDTYFQDVVPVVKLMKVFNSGRRAVRVNS